MSLVAIGPEKGHPPSDFSLAGYQFDAHRRCRLTRLRLANARASRPHLIKKGFAAGTTGRRIERESDEDGGLNIPGKRPPIPVRDKARQQKGQTTPHGPPGP
jgi:hypothetical protein